MQYSKSQSRAVQLTYSEEDSPNTYVIKKNQSNFQIRKFVAILGRQLYVLYLTFVPMNFCRRFRTGSGKEVPWEQTDVCQNYRYFGHLPGLPQHIYH
jgi:hypothetical protein